MSDDSFESVAAEVGGLAPGAARVRSWAGVSDLGDGVVIGLADLLVTSAAIIDEARAAKAKDLRAIATLVRAHRECLESIGQHVQTEAGPSEFDAFLEDLQTG